ncbi:MAG TPA: sigma-70 family RNA polymerase sigma factor [Gemmataceae bacterium]|jgi:RNA polymerase sigma-70 factor (ECF subfamily)
MTTTREINGSDARSSSATSRSLLARVKADEPDAWNRLVHLYAPLVLHWCRGKGLQDPDVADIFQEVFRAVVTHLGGFRRERPEDTFRGWLRRITQNKLRDHFRRLDRETRGVGGSSAQERFTQLPEPTPVEVDLPTDDEGERALFSRAIDLIRAEFEERTWAAFWRTAVDGRAAKDVAADLSMSPGAVRVAKSRVIHRLREELGDTEPL